MSKTQEFTNPAKKEKKNPGTIQYKALASIERCDCQAASDSGGMRTGYRSEYHNQMRPVKRFAVFGEPVEILVASDATAGLSATMTQVSPPGGGPPPHSHQNEDETFYVLEGEYEVLLNGVFYKLLAGDAIHAMRGSIHTFRNVGVTTGKILIHIVPGGFENYLEEISHCSVPEEMPQVLEISKRYGVTFVS